MEFLLVLLGAGLVFLGIFLPIYFNNKKYEKFVLENSEAIRNLYLINSRYSFQNITDYDLIHSYDNENFYDDISCEDYLIYDLQFYSKKVNIQIGKAKDNAKKYKEYVSEVKEKCILGSFPNVEIPKDTRKIRRIEAKYFNNMIYKPKTEFKIFVKLRLTNINGKYRASKNVTFYADEILEYEKRLAKKNGYFYLDEGIWASICRVERGKVTNKMRFAIYKRDGYRCKKCGRRTNDLEIDHIIPIAKGGKSTPNNLQTLCHRCNVKKGANIE